LNALAVLALGTAATAALAQQAQPLAVNPTVLATPAPAARPLASDSAPAPEMAKGKKKAVVKHKKASKPAAKRATHAGKKHH
jgi:hypothetical protein